MRIVRFLTMAAIGLGTCMAAACGSDGSTTVAAKKPGAAARVTVTTSPSGTVAAGTAAGTFAVTVTDETGTPVPGVQVSFGAIGTLSLASTSATTDAKGVATTLVTAGTVASTATASATAAGVATAATASVVITAGPTSKIVIAPKTLRLTVVGDTARVTAAAQDQYGNVAAASTIVYSVTDPTVVSIDQSGLVRAVKAGGTALVISTSSGKADSTSVTVLAAGSTACTGLASPGTLGVGQSQTFTGTQYGCVSGATTGAEFALVAFNASTDGVSALNASITGSGLASPPSTTQSVSGEVAGAAASVAEQLAHGAEAFHAQMMRTARDWAGAHARATATSVAALRASRSGARSDAIGVVPATAKVGDLVSVNVGSGYCGAAAVNRATRVTAIGSKSIILADTLNPANGFATADFQRIAANFDTLVYTLDVSNFGAPSDIDGNGRVAIVITRAVNELVDASSAYYVGGYFNPRDIFPRKAAIADDDCANSNEGEMIFLLAPAPAGINGVSHTVGAVDSLSSALLAHEFQHLINATRRYYVNFAPVVFEELWLNEGLSHIAEELLYYRQSGMSPRQNLNDATLRLNSRSTYPYFVMDAATNFPRFGAYLSNPSKNSPYANDDQLATRGATWSYLRYAADQLGTTDGSIWQRMDNSTTTGLGTLQAGFGSDPLPLFKSWAVANFMDDFAGGTDPAFQHKSWNFRDLFTVNIPPFTAYPLAVSQLTNGVKTDVAVRGGSASYLRLAVAAGKEALLTFTSGGGLPNAQFQFVIVRTK